MSEKRRDNRNRILHNGESQRQDGRYAYKYKDINGSDVFTIIREETNAVYKLPYVGNRTSALLIVMVSGALFSQ